MNLDPAFGTSSSFFVRAWGCFGDVFLFTFKEIFGFRFRFY